MSSFLSPWQMDAALIAAQVIYDRPSQIAYAKREKPFDKLNRHYKFHELVRGRGKISE